MQTQTSTKNQPVHIEMTSQQGEQDWMKKNCQVMLENRGIHPNANCRYKGGDSLMHAVLKYGVAPQEKLQAILNGLLKSGTDSNQTDNSGRTPLMLAAWSGNTQAVTTIGKHPQTILDIQDVKGNTSLSYAVLSDSVDVVRALLHVLEFRQGFRILVMRNYEGKTPVELARSTNRPQICELIAKEQKKLRSMFQNPGHQTMKGGHLASSGFGHSSAASAKGAWMTKSHSFAATNKLRPATSDPAPKMEKAVTHAQNVATARKRLLSMVGVFHDK